MFCLYNVRFTSNILVYAQITMLVSSSLHFHYNQFSCTRMLMWVDEHSMIFITYFSSDELIMLRHRITTVISTDHILAYDIVKPSQRRMCRHVLVSHVLC